MRLAAPLALAAALAAAPAAAAEPPPGAIPVEVTVGAAVGLCRDGWLICPASNAFCDDVGVATLRTGPQGLEVLGVKEGRTTCSAAAPTQVRAIFAVTVKAKPPP